MAVEASGSGAGSSLLPCTDIPASNTTAPLRLFAPPAFKPAGTATLTYDRGAGRLDVRTTAIGVVAGSPLAAERRRGVFQANGPLGSPIGTPTANHACGLRPTA